jgi:hypothetical protein
MGMDLIPRHSDDIDSFHVNWTGWSVLLDLLDNLGCDLEEVSGVNDGAYIKAGTLRSWGKAINDAVSKGELKNYFVKNDTYVGGGYHKFYLLNHGDPDEVITPETAALLSDLTKDDIDWLGRFTEFCKFAGGCRQY